MKPSFKYWIFLVAIYFAVTSIIAASLIGAWASLDESQQQLLSGMINKLLPFPLLGTITILFIIGALVNLLFNDYIIPTLKLAESARIIASVNPDHRIELKSASKEIEYLCQIINQSADAFTELQRDVAGKIAVAQATLNEERTRLAALMSELPHGVIVCNTDGQVLLYNQQAQQILSSKTAVQPNQGILGLGRSIFSILERDPVVHGLEMLHRCHSSGRTKLVNRTMMALSSGLYLRINMAPFFTEQDDTRSISGVVLTLEDMTSQIEADNRRDALIQSLIDDQQQYLQTIRESISAILEQPQLSTAELQDYRSRIDESSRVLLQKSNEARASYALHQHELNRSEHVLANNLLDIISQNISDRSRIQVATVAPKGIWMQIDSYTVVQAFGYLADLLDNQTDIREMIITATDSDQQDIEISVAWPPLQVSRNLMMSWQSTPLLTDTTGKSFSFQEMIDRMEGSISFIEKGDGIAGLLLKLPPLPQDRRVSLQSEIEHRPVSYEFDLFNRADLEELGDIPLARLTYVVFDTETTGLNPSQGDEIIQLGAIRIVNGQLLYHETIDQLIDPKRFVPPESVAIHGIEPSLLKGQPTIDKVLPHFHRFAENSVLVAHNAAFDMRFLELQERKTGIVFTNPVLDTLLLSSIVHPNQDSHSLEELAARLNVTIVGRHTALGDAIVTGEVLLKLIPLLEAQGITTLNAALAASVHSPFAKFAY